MVNGDYNVDVVDGPKSCYMPNLPMFLLSLNKKHVFEPRFILIIKSMV